MDLIIWLEQIYLRQLKRREKEAMSRNEKITDNGGTGYSSRKQLDMYTKAAREYDRGLLGGMEKSTDPIIQSVINEVKVRAIDDARHSRGR